jgi:hypothetical protein
MLKRRGINILKWYLGQPHEAVGGMEEVDAMTREKPCVERTWQPNDIVWRCHSRRLSPIIARVDIHHILDLFQRSEEIVEIILWQVVKEEKEFQWLMAS